MVGNPLTGSPFASTAVLAAFAGKDRSTVNQRLLHWVPLAYPQWEASSFAAWGCPAGVAGEVIALAATD